MTIGGAVLMLVGDRRSGARAASAGFWAGEQARHRATSTCWSGAGCAGRSPRSSIMLCAALAYYLLPDVKQKFKFITPGSVIGTLVWLLATWGFSRLRRPLRQLQRHLRLDRRRHRAADLVLHHRVHLPHGRRDERDHRARVAGGEGQRRARARARRRPPPSERPSADPGRRGRQRGERPPERSRGGLRDAPAGGTER